MNRYLATLFQKKKQEYVAPPERELILCYSLSTNISLLRSEARPMQHPPSGTNVGLRDRVLCKFCPSGTTYTGGRFYNAAKSRRDNICIGTMNNKNLFVPGGTKFVLIILFVISIIAYGCSGNRGADKIRFVSLAWQEQSLKANKDIIGEWNKLHPDKQVEYVQGNWNAIYDYLITSFETGDVPDVFHYEASMITDFGTRGNLADLRPYISDNMKNDIYSTAWESVTLKDGKIIGVPFLFESLIVLYNKDIFEKNNIVLPTPEDPWDWNNLRTIAKQLTIDTDNDNVIDQYGAAIGLRSSANIILNLTLGFGGGYFYKENGEYTVRIKQPEEELLTLISEMIYRDKSLSPSSVNQSGSGLIPSFYNGKFAMLIGIGTWARQQIVENAPESFQWGVLEPIRQESQEQGSNTQTLSVPAGSERKKDAVEFIEFFLSKNNLARLALSDWMNPTRISVTKMPEFQNEEQGWKKTISIIDDLKMGPWLHVPGFSEWKGRVANPIFQEYFSGRMDFNEMTLRLQEESDYVLSRYKISEKK